MYCESRAIHARARDFATAWMTLFSRVRRYDALMPRVQRTTLTRAASPPLCQLVVENPTGEVITSEGSRTLAGTLPSLTFVAREPVQVKGKTDPIQIFEAQRSETA